MEDKTLCSKVTFHFKNYLWVLSGFRISPVLLAVLPLSFHVCVFPTILTLQSSGTPNVTHSVRWDTISSWLKTLRAGMPLVTAIFHIPTQPFLTTPYLVWQRQEHPFPTRILLNIPLLYLVCKTYCCKWFFLLNYQIP